jgi:hypothetical protein
MKLTIVSMLAVALFGMAAMAEDPAPATGAPAAKTDAKAKVAHKKATEKKHKK